MSFLIKALLSNSEVEYYKNVKDSATVTATRITLCNTSASPVTVNLSFYNEVKSETFEMGAVLFGKSIAANETLTEVLDRDMQPDDKLCAEASTADVIAMSVDIVGVDGRYEAPAILD